MFLVNVKRIFRAGFVNFWRNRFVSLSSVLAMTIALFVISSVIFLSAIFDFTLKEIQAKVDINAYFVTKADESDVLLVKKSLEGLPQIKTVTYTSASDALKAFKARHADDAYINQALGELDDANPLGAVLNIKAKDPSQYESIANFLKSNYSSFIDTVTFFQNSKAIDRLTSITTLANKFGFGLAIAFILIAIIVTLNTIRLVIFTSKDEISVMRLVGASDKYVKGPFVVSGMIYGLLSAAIVLIGLFPLTYWLGQTAQSFLSGLNLFDFYLTNFASIFLIIVVSGLFIGALSAYVAVRRYLKHK
ncbi:MAG: permease-like cell division protein FtsX [bacterium]